MDCFGPSRLFRLGTSAEEDEDRRREMIEENSSSEVLTVRSLIVDLLMEGSRGRPFVLTSARPS